MGLLDFIGLGKSAPAAAAAQSSAAPEQPAWPQGAVAQLVGASLISPLNDPGYALDHYLDKLLALGPDDQAPKKTYQNGVGSGRRNGLDQNLLAYLAGSFAFPVTHYNRDVEGYHQFLWNEVRMEQLAVIAGFTRERTQEEAQDLWCAACQSFGENSRPGSFTLASGNSGWTTLETALRAIPDPAAKVIWLVTVDSPIWPKDGLPNEAAVLLMLAHPGFASGRSPLAYFTAPVVVPIKGVEHARGESPDVAALRQAVEQACAAAGIAPSAIGTVARDCGRLTREASKRLGHTAAALLPLLPDVDVVSGGIDVASAFGELNANTVSYTLLLAAYAANRRRHPVLYVSSLDPEAGRAMLVLPNPDPAPIADPARIDRVASAREQWYRPWWGERLDGKWDF